MSRGDQMQEKKNSVNEGVAVSLFRFVQSTSDGYILFNIFEKDNLSLN